MYGDGSSGGTLAATGVTLTVGGMSMGLGNIVLFALAAVLLGVVLIRLAGRNRRYLITAGAGQPLGMTAQPFGSTGRSEHGGAGVS